MLYDVDDENNNSNDIINIEYSKNSRRKIIVCGVIIIICVIVILITIIVSLNRNDDTDTAKVAEVQQSENKENEKNVIEPQVASSTKKSNASKDSQNEHVQIEKHNLDEIKTKFVPTANPNAQQEIKNIYYSDEKVAYLTFDDGPSKNITPQILDTLKQENVPATFFVLGSRVELNPDLVKREYEEGHYIANHGYSHEYAQIYRSKDTVFEEYAKCENAVRNALGNPNYNTYLFRFPGGSSGGKYASIKSEAKELLYSYGIAQTNWNCLNGDAEGKKTHDALLSYVKETMQGDGSLIILMHDASDKSYTAESLPETIHYLKEQGYTFKNFYEIFK